jgi:hypothetical protein
MYEVLKSEKFATFFSFMIGVSIVAMLIPVCKGDSCFVKKAPSVEEMKNATYRISQKCYQFKPETTECPATGVIEAFRGSSMPKGAKFKPLSRGSDIFKIFALVSLWLFANYLANKA